MPCSDALAFDQRNCFPEEASSTFVCSANEIYPNIFLLYSDKQQGYVKLVRPNFCWSINSNAAMYNLLELQLICAFPIGEEQMHRHSPQQPESHSLIYLWPASLASSG